MVPRASGSICGCARRGHWGDSRIFVCFYYIRISSLSFWFHTWLCTKRSEVRAESCLWSACARVNAAGVPRLPRLKVELNRRKAGAVSKDYVSLVHRHEQPRSCCRHSPKCCTASGSEAGHYACCCHLSIIPQKPSSAPNLCLFFCLPGDQSDRFYERTLHRVWIEIR